MKIEIVDESPFVSPAGDRVCINGDGYDVRIYGPERGAFDEWHGKKCKVTIEEVEEGVE